MPAQVMLPPPSAKSSTDAVQGRLRVEAVRGGEIREVTRFLSALQEVHDAFRFVDAVAELPKSADPGVRLALLRQGPVAPGAEVLRREEAVLVSRVNISSPGFWEFLGKLNFLETIRQYLQDRHERRKDKAYRERHEDDKLRLENEMRTTILLKTRLQVFRDVGFTDAQLQEIARAYFEKPLLALAAAQDAGMIAGAEIVK